MPKFMPPKNLKSVEKKQPNEENEEKLQQLVAAIKDETKESEEVALRNSQNTLHNRNAKSLENKSTCTIGALIDEGDNNGGVKKPLYTTSIYINSCGDVDSSVKKVSQDDITVSFTEPEVRKVYTTTAAVHRYSDNNDRTLLHWVNYLGFFDFQPV